MGLVNGNVESVEMSEKRAKQGFSGRVGRSEGYKPRVNRAVGGAKRAKFVFQGANSTRDTALPGLVRDVVPRGVLAAVFSRWDTALLGLVRVVGAVCRFMRWDTALLGLVRDVVLAGDIWHMQHVGCGV